MLKPASKVLITDKIYGEAISYLYYDAQSKCIILHMESGAEYGYCPDTLVEVS